MFMKKNRSLNLKYAGSQIFYFAAFASMMGYASVFLLDKEKWLHLLNHSRKYKLPCEDYRCYITTNACFFCRQS